MTRPAAEATDATIKAASHIVSRDRALSDCWIASITRNLLVLSCGDKATQPVLKHRYAVASESLSFRDQLNGT